MSATDFAKTEYADANTTKERHHHRRLAGGIQPTPHRQPTDPPSIVGHAQIVAQTDRCSAPLSLPTTPNVRACAQALTIRLAAVPLIPPPSPPATQQPRGNTGYPRTSTGRASKDCHHSQTAHDARPHARESSPCQTATRSAPTLRAQAPSNI